MTLPEMIQLIANNGLSVVLCIYLVVVNNKTVQENTFATQELTTLVRGMNNKGGGE